MRQKRLPLQPVRRNAAPGFSCAKCGTIMPKTAALEGNDGMLYCSEKCRREDGYSGSVFSGDKI
jgi:hypothetical protein